MSKLKLQVRTDKVKVNHPEKEEKCEKEKNQLNGKKRFLYCRRSYKIDKVSYAQICVDLFPAHFYFVKMARNYAKSYAEFRGNFIPRFSA